ncbi:phage tail tape measure protein [Maridesulfovibrio ferrireducens]|uniref:phage tail tape measure protein n=1 Tax=Maridesulfovibrio ferrireducens TaxID=246191 RepID=UPI001A1B13D2|nr:phage tail tape measure protein [Maridesulfovibrio ferrireducens]MBI9112246.1 phage tail tape measure protein [Maridesulfovibrio ferrireducens]
MNSIVTKFVIGGAVGGLVAALGTAESKVGKLGSAISDLKDKKPFKAGEALAQQQKRVVQLYGAYQESETRLKSYTQAMQRSGANKKVYTQLIEKEEKKLKNLSKRHLSARREYKSQVVAIKAVGQSVRGLQNDYRSTSSEVEKLTRKQSALAKSMKARSARAGQRQNLRTEVGETAAMGAVMLAPVLLAAQAEQSEIRLSTAINTDDEANAMIAARRSAKQLAKTGLVAYNEAFDIQYALNSAGMTAKMARAGSSVVAKVAKVTNGQAEGVGEVLATAYNNLGKKMMGTDEEKLNRIGDLFTKTQVKFQLTNFDQLGESMKKAAASMNTYGMGIEQGLTMLGTLNSAGVVGGEAGTALNAVLRSLGKAQEEFGTDIVRDDNGQLDLISTLEQIQEATADMDTDERSQILQKTFGDEGLKGVAPLLEKLKELRTVQKDVSEGSRGIVDKQAQKYLKSGMVKIEKIKNQLVMLGSTVGTVLLPGVIAVTSVFTGLLTPVAWMAENFPGVTAVVGGAAFGFLALNLAIKGTKYIGSMAADGISILKDTVTWLSDSQKLATVRTYAFAASQKIVAVGTKVWTGAQWLLNAAMTANPIGLVVAGVAALAGGAYLLINNWSAVKDFFSGLWDGIVSGAKWVWNAITTLFENSPFGLVIDAFKSVSSWFGSDEPAPSNKTVVKSSAPVARMGGEIFVDDTKSTSSVQSSATHVSSTAQTSSPISLTIEQNITVSGSDESTVRKALSQANEGLEPRIHKIMDQWFEKKERLRFA